MDNKDRWQECGETGILIFDSGNIKGYSYFGKPLNSSYDIAILENH